MTYRKLTLEDVSKEINSLAPLMFDTETIGLYGKIRLAQFYQKHWESPILVEWPNTYELVALLNKQHFVAHNAHYDISTIQENLGGQSWIPEKFDCTFLLSRLHYFLRESFSLDAVATYALGFNPYEGKDLQKSNWGAPVLSEEQLEYAANDAIYLQTIYDIVKESEEDNSYKLDMLCLRYCLDFQNNGMPVDIVRLEDRYISNMTRIKELNVPINVNSYQQVRPYINSSLSDDLGLAMLAAQGNERAITVRETRKLIKSNSFLTKFKNTLNTTSGYPAILGKFKVSARSGRTTSDDQNLQQLPRKLKDIFGVPIDGDLVIIFSDFAQIQLRAVCAKTGDKTMEKLFRALEDLHNFVAKMIFGPDFTPEQRQICKTANFGLLFGAGVNTFINILLKEAGLWLSEADATKVKNKWSQLWTEITNWQKQGIKDWKKGLPWETPLGRRYTSKMMTDQLAMQIQGFEAEVAKLAMHYMLPKIKLMCDEIKLVNFVHDSYIFVGPNNKEIYSKAAIIIANSMQEAWAEMSTEVAIKDLPMPVTVRVGWNWGDIEKGKFIFEHKQ